MPYAEGRSYCDADSHIMELADWLAPYADPGVREKLRPLYLGGAGKLADQAVSAAAARRGDVEAARAAEANLMGAKGWSALGAFDRDERKRALDLLGFERQLVFSTFAPTQYRGDDLELLYGGARAHNRAMADFCSQDARLIGVASVPWGDPAHTLREAEEAIRLGCGAILVDSAPSGELSPTHPDYHPFWAQLEASNTPFMLHIGGGGRTLRRQFHQNGKKVTDWLGGGENIRSKDFMTVHNAPETFLSCMVLDGMFETFPRLRGGCIEQGALWVPAWLKRLDIAQDTFQKTEPALRLPRRASEYVHGHVWFTPFPTEPVGWLVEQAGEDLFLFSSDYPHPEGGRDPIRRFEQSLAGAPASALDGFYSENFRAMMG
jgi:predicted TIM-barrel fold metal-dependent hydrolase